MLLFLIHQYGSLRTCLIFFNMFWCQHATFCGFVSTYGSPRTCWVCIFIMFLLIKSVAIKLGAFQGFFTPFVTNLPVLDNWVLVRFVGCLCFFQQYQNPNRTSNYLCRKFSVVVEVTQKNSVKKKSSDFIITTFEIQQAGRESWTMIAFDLV